MAHNDDIFLLTIRGTLLPSTVEASRQAHNATAGNPQGVAAARALGDLSHNVFVRFAEAPAGSAGEILFLDLWNNPAGFEKFFSDPQVQAGAGLVFTTREPSVWSRAAEFRSHVMPSPPARKERFVGLARGVVKSREQAQAAFDGIAKSSINAARMAGQVSHDVYFRMTKPGEAASLELLAIDTWHDADGMHAYYKDPTHLAPLKDVFAGPPAFSTWHQPPGEWAEW